jgi:hypothetical protein
MSAAGHHLTERTTLFDSPSTTGKEVMQKAFAEIETNVKGMSHTVGESNSSVCNGFSDESITLTITYFEWLSGSYHPQKNK